MTAASRKVKSPEEAIRENERRKAELLDEAADLRDLFEILVASGDVDQAESLAVLLENNVSDLCAIQDTLKAEFQKEMEAIMDRLREDDRDT